MGEISLSIDLKIHGANIRASKNRVGQEIIEIGRELSEAKAKCKRGEWLPFLEKECDFSQQSANDYMRIFEEFRNHHHDSNLGKRALLFLATLTIEQKEQAEQIIEKPIEKIATNEEVNQLKKKLKEEEKKRIEAERDKFNAENKVKNLINNPIIREVKDEKLIKTLQNGLDKAQKELEALKFKNTSNFDEEKAELEQKKLEHEAEIHITTIRIEIKKFLERVSINAFSKGAIATCDDKTKKSLMESLNSLELFINEFKNQIKNIKRVV
jgi:hypothetical protein